jgi:hypothetical protein
MVEEIEVSGENHRYVIRTKNPFYTVQHIFCRKLGPNPHPAQTLVTGRYKSHASDALNRSATTYRTYIIYLGLCSLS